MSQISTKVEFFIALAKAKTVIARRFDNRLSFHGLGFSDFMILYHLSVAEGGKLRRTDLAEKIGLTASGITRMLLPMEKIGLVKRESNKDDARVSFVSIASGGKELLKDAMERVELLAEDLLPQENTKKLNECIELFTELGKTVVY